MSEDMKKTDTSRRDLLKTLGSTAAVAGAAGISAAGAQAQPSTASAGAKAPPPQGPYALPWTPPDPDVPGRQSVARIPDDYFIPERFKGKTVLVTGCARGMGRMAAVRLAREGANVVAVDWLNDEGRAVVEGIRKEGGKAVFLAGDIAEDKVCADMVRLAVSTYGGLDAALNNAGVMDAIHPSQSIDYAKQKSLAMARIHEASDDYWHVVMRVNATGTFYSLRHELRQMMAQGRGGAIVNVASVAGLRGFGGTPSYVASKHAVNGLTKNAAIDYAPYGIRVNSVCMGTTVTPMYERAFELIKQRTMTGQKDSGISMMKIRSLLEFSDQKKMGSSAAEQVAIMLFLLSPEASNITGANYATDGGFTAY